MNTHKLMQEAISNEKENRKQRKKFLKRNEEDFFLIAKGLIPIQEYVVRFSFDANSLDIAIAGDHHVFTGLFRALRKLGYNCSAGQKPTKKIISYWSATWYHEDRNDHCELWVSFSSTKCTRVKIGTKMVEQPIYETVCE